MYLHMLQNPCLSFEWTSLWPLMMDQGWLAVDTTKDGLAVDGMDKDQKFLYAFRPNEFRNELVAGTTVFASKLAVAQYIARFPYLLQNDSTLMETLQRHGWKKNNRQQFTAPLESISRSLKDTRVHLWLHPHVLFQHYWAECGEDRILSAIA